MRLFITLLFAFSLFVNCSKDEDSATLEEKEKTDTGSFIDDETDVDGEPDEDEVNDEIDENEGEDGENEDEIVEFTFEQKRLIEEFNYRIFKKSRNSPNEYVRKWKTDMKIYLSGSFSTNQREIVKSFIDQLKGINSDFNIEITSNTSDFNTEIYISSAQEYIKDRPNYIAGFIPQGTYPSGSSNVLYEVATQKIYSSLIWVENPNDSFVKDVKREILFSLGLGSSEDNTSILYSFFNEVSTLNEDDVFVVKTLFNPLIEPGLNETQVNEIIKNNMKSFF